MDRSQLISHRACSYQNSIIILVRHFLGFCKPLVNLRFLKKLILIFFPIVSLLFPKSEFLKVLTLPHQKCFFLLFFMSFWQGENWHPNVMHPPTQKSLSPLTHLIEMRSLTRLPTISGSGHNLCCIGKCLCDAVNNFNAQKPPYFFDHKLHAEISL